MSKKLLMVAFISITNAVFAGHQPAGQENVPAPQETFEDKLKTQKYITYLEILQFTASGNFEELVRFYETTGNDLALNKTRALTSRYQVEGEGITLPEFAAAELAICKNSGFKLIHSRGPALAREYSYEQKLIPELVEKICNGSEPIQDLVKDGFSVKYLSKEIAEYKTEHLQDYVNPFDILLRDGKISQSEYEKRGQ